MHTPSFARYVKCLDAGDLSGAGAVMLESVRMLERRRDPQWLGCPA